jgi:hypothetical protein
MMSGLHDVLSPAGPQALALSHLWWIALAVCVLVFVALMAALAYGVWRPRVTAEMPPDVALLDRSEPRIRRWVTVGVAVSAPTRRCGNNALLDGAVQLSTDRCHDEFPRSPSAQALPSSQR